MKIPFDQNIPFRILKLLPTEYQNSAQVRTLGLEGATDREIWDYARKKGCAIATFDADFVDIAYLHGLPLKITWLRTGNMATPEVAKLMAENRAIISSFLADDKYKAVACLELE